MRTKIWAFELIGIFIAEICWVFLFAGVSGLQASRNSKEKRKAVVLVTLKDQKSSFLGAEMWG